MQWQRWIAACALLTATVAFAQGTYPERPVRMIVGFPPGTTADIIPRAMAPTLTTALGQPVLVENRPGAGSSLAAEHVARAAPDGYTLLVSSVANTVLPALSPGKGVDFGRELAPVIHLADNPAMLVTHTGGPESIEALVLSAKAKPGSIVYGSSGTGTGTHLYGELFALGTGTSLTHVPYKGSSQAVTDLLAGRVTLLFTPASTVVAHVEAGKLRALGVIARERMSAFPQVRRLEEAGISGFDTGLWFGLNAPAGTPPAIIDRLRREVARALVLPEVRDALVRQSILPAPGTTESFGAFIQAELTKWARVIQSAGIKGE